MNVRIKVKHLVYLGFVLFTLMPLYVNWIAPALELKRLEQGYFGGDWEKDKQRVLDEIESTPSQKRRLQLIERFMIVHDDFNRLPFYQVQVTPYSYGASSDQIQFSIQESEQYLWEYVHEAQYNISTNSAASILSSYYAANQQFAKIQQLYHILEEKAEQEEAQSIFLKGLESFLWLEVEKLLQQGKYSQAYERLEKAIEEYRQRIEQHNQQVKQHNQQGNTQPNQSFREYLNSEPHLLQTMQNKFRVALAEGEENFPVLRGKALRSDGTPLSGLGVGLREGGEKDPHYSSINWSTSRVSTPYFTQTAEDGSFVFYGLTPGKYRFSFGASLEQVDGWVSPIEQDDWVFVEYGTEVEKDLIFRPLMELEQPVNQEVVTGENIRFAWQPVEEASSYSLSLGIQIEGGSFSQVWELNIPHAYLEIPLEQLYELSFIVGTGIEDDRFSGAGLLGFANPEATFIWSVGAYNEEGKLITQSSGYRLHKTTIGNLPFFSIQARELSAADRLLLAQEYVEAFQVYEEEYRTNPDNLHSLRMMTRLANSPLSFSREEQEPLIRVSKAKMETYLLTLAEKQPSSRTVYDLVKFYYGEENWAEHNEWFQRYKELELSKGKALNDYIQAIYISALMKQHKLAEVDRELTLIESEEELFRVIDSELNPEQQKLVQSIWFAVAQDRKHP